MGEGGMTDMLLNRIEKTSLVVASIMVLVSLAWMNVSVSASVAGGAAIAIGSFVLLHLFVRRAFGGSGTSRVTFLVAIVVKLAVVATILWVIVVYVPIQPVAFLVGLSAILISLLVEAAFAWKASA